jgi:hypothetical protein
MTAMIAISPFFPIAPNMRTDLSMSGAPDG